VNCGSSTVPLGFCSSRRVNVRTKAEGLLAGLSAGARAKYGTPERLVGLFISQGVLESSAFQFGTNSVGGGDDATLAVRVRVNGRDNETKTPMETPPGLKPADAFNPESEPRLGLA
jgi:hypothetical protein